MLRVGLTGGIASGKSVVARELRCGLGLPVIDADQVARQVVEPGRPAFEEVVARFGPEVVGPDGRIDRAALGRVVFADPAARAELEAVTHPRIVEETLRWLEARAREGARVAVFEAPLLFEAGLEGLFDLVVVVTSSLEAQLARASARDGLSASEVEARVAAQMPLEEKARRAHRVIRNDGTLDELIAEARALGAELLALADRGRD
jgi:dephospho-CoA kinase